MYAAIDIGGTKTLVAALTNTGKIVESQKFPTPHNYSHFLLELQHTLHNFKNHDFIAAGVGMPATVIDRHQGVGIAFGNLPWKNVHVQHDVEKLVHAPVVIENDGKLGALNEALLLKGKFSRVMYITVSTGIGVGLVVDGEIDTNVGDAGGRSMLLAYKGKRVSWESFASGRAIVERYGKFAEEIHDNETWTKICRDLAPGFIELIAICQPEVIVIGGSVGTYFKRYHKILEAELESFKLPLIPLPKLRQAQKPEEAVLFGCFNLAKRAYASAR